MKWARNALQRAASKLETVRPSQVLEEERLGQCQQGRDDPANIGAVLSSKYQIVGEFGFGVPSTVWLARDLEYTRDQADKEEFQISKPLDRGSSWHPGYPPVGKAVDLFTIRRPGDDHPCLVQKPMWESFRYLHSTISETHGRLTEDRLQAGLVQAFLALDYLHTECKIVHTGNALIRVLLDIKERFWLCFMLKTDWSYPLDSWSVGALGWDLFQGEHRFYGNDPDGKGYSTRAHLAEAIGNSGPASLGFCLGTRSYEFVTEDGTWKQNIDLPPRLSLEKSEEFLEGRNTKMFLACSKDLLQDRWLND
ncbi:hypothetical protein BJX76DRAFT_351623 [Aspergillus varians]